MKAIIPVNLILENSLAPNYPNMIIIIALSVLGFLLLAAIIVAICFASLGESKNQRRERENLDYNVRVYTFDYAKKTFYFFDKFDLKHTKTYDEQQFINQFMPSDKYRVQDWLRGIVQNNNYSQYIQADLKIHHPNVTISSMLQLTSVNRQKNIIHFESFLLPYCSTTSLMSPRKRKRFFLNDDEACQDFIKNNDEENYLGSVYYLKLYRANSTKENDEKYLAEINTKIVSILTKFLTKTKKLHKISDTEEIIIDKSTISRVMTMNIASTIETALTQFLNFNTPDVDLFVAIGISTTAFYNQDYFQAKDQSGMMAKAISNNLTNEKVLFYDPSFFDKFNKEKGQLEEVKMIVKNSTFRVFFTPTINIKTGEKSLYFTKVIPFGTSLKTFREVIDVSVKIKEGPLRIFRGINEKCQKSLATYKDNNINLIINVPYLEIADFLKAIQSTSYSKITWTLALPETDLLAYLDDQATIKKTFQRVIENQCKIAIMLANSSPSLPSQILRYASFFLVGDRYTSHLKDSRTVNELRIIGSSYQDYPAPIVYFGLKDFNDIELGAHFGGRIFQCDALALPSSKAEELDPEKVNYVIKETENLFPHTSNTVSKAISIEPRNKKETIVIPTIRNSIKKK